MTDTERDNKEDRKRTEGGQKETCREWKKLEGYVLTKFECTGVSAHPPRSRILSSGTCPLRYSRSPQTRPEREGRGVRVCGRGVGQSLGAGLGRKLGFG